MNRCIRGLSHRRARGLRGRAALLSAGLVCVALSACGSSGSASAGAGSASTLLKQTFSGSHTVKSGNLNVSLTITPSGSSTISGPIALSLGGPFQSLGRGKLPKLDFKASASAMGKSESVGFVSTGASAYVTLKGASYQLPAALLQRLQSRSSQLGSSGGGGSGAKTLRQLGINPLRWLINPTIVGHDTIDGTDTTHVRAGVNVAAFLSDVNVAVQKAASAGVSGAAAILSISPSTRARIASAVKNPTVDVWTGTRGQTLRKLALELTLPVSGRFSRRLGGLSSAAFALSVQYGALNLPQTIAAPAAVRPFSQLAAKLRALQQALSGVASLGGGASPRAVPPSGGAPRGGASGGAALPGA